MSFEERVCNLNMPQYLVSLYIVSGAATLLSLAFRR